MDNPNNLVWHPHSITGRDRARHNAQRPFVVWFTGLSGSGKSTLAGALEERLFAQGHRCYLLDGDNIRHGLNKDLGFGDPGTLRRADERRRLADSRCQRRGQRGSKEISAATGPGRPSAR